MAESQDVRDAKVRVDQARAALDADIATLNDRLPAGASVARAGLAGGGGLAVVGIVAKWAQGRLAVRSEEKSLAREARIQAKAIAAAMAAQAEAQREAEERKAARDAEAEAKAARKRRRGAAAGAGAAAAAASQAAESMLDEDDDEGTSWGLLLLIAAVVAAVVAYVTSQRDDDIWITEAPDERGPGDAGLGATDSVPVTPGTEGAAALVDDGPMASPDRDEVATDDDGGTDDEIRPPTTRPMPPTDRPS